MVAADAPSSALQRAAPPEQRRPGRAVRWWWLPPLLRSPLFAGCLAVLVLVPLFVSLGQWQWQKGERKAAQQALRDARSGSGEVTLPAAPVAAASAAAEALQFRRLRLVGRFLPERQFLLDNRVHRQHVGFHVIAPFQLDGGDAVVLVDRGWVPGGASHQTLPEFATPVGRMSLDGVAMLPPRRFFSLSATGNTPDWQPAAPPAGSPNPPSRPSSPRSRPGSPAAQPQALPAPFTPRTTPPVWQHLDVDAFARQSGLAVHGVIVQLDAASPACFICEWPRPDERIERHYAYAMQWFGFALTTIGIWLFFVFRRRSK